ncbi:hypothetical protein B0H66DRAFT_644576 [Apodospora peruviana]|uniref:Chitin-binding type-1 domain-containing protein n=1 Tax=Apodospora peruviana TaxID=516989 RepID=A0AAE0LYA4_9PEZI|nr:hypothetical protein B0H66DRAFT_644576 [Apodospora peruviana]
MLALIPGLFFLPAAALAGAVLPEILDARAVGVVSPNLTCGTLLAGANNGYTCPGEAACCSQYGYCGTGDSFCLTTGGCQSRYSNATTSCQAPRSGVTVTIDGTCGSTGAGKSGYRCPATLATCCSASGYCGNTTDHCGTGCQAGFGTCGGGTRPRTSRNLF